MDTLGRVIKRVASGSASTSNRFAALEALDALSGQVWLTSDINHLAEEAVYRPLAAIPGFIDFQRPAPVGGVPTTLAQFDWIGPFDDTPTPAVACLGAHAVFRVPSNPTTYPRLVLRARIVPPTLGTEYLNACLAVSPGYPSTPMFADTSSTTYTIARTAGNGAAWADLEIAVRLTADLVSSIATTPMLGAPSSGVPASPELVVADVFTAYVSANCTTGKCSMVAITLGLEP